MWLVAVLISYRLFQDYVLAPHLMRRGVKLHPLLVLFGVLAGGEIGNVPGIFLSVPVLALIRLVYYEVRKQHVIPEELTLAAEGSGTRENGCARWEPSLEHGAGSALLPDETKLQKT